MENNNLIMESNILLPEDNEYISIIKYFPFYKKLYIIFGKDNFEEFTLTIKLPCYYYKEPLRTYFPEKTHDPKLSYRVVGGMMRDSIIRLGNHYISTNTILSKSDIHEFLGDSIINVLRTWKSLNEK